MDDFTVRKIKPSDYTNHYLQLLEQDFSINRNTISLSDFTHFVNNLHDYHQIFVIATELHKEEDYTRDNINHVQTIVGSVTIFIETKIIHNFGKVAHIEDVIVDNACRGKGLGKLIVTKCIDYARTHNCYKIILNCSDENIHFYEKCGFSKKESEMTLYFLTV
jgi:glucosamine-phosphate N-acetyltransferase